MQIQNAQKIHMIGIGGIGMSALARLFISEGKTVTGSDRTVSDITCGLEALGIVIAREHSAQNIPEGIDMVVYTEAMAHDNAEMVAARETGVPMMNYFEALGSVTSEYYLIAVAGTHGKTTTTAMLTDILEEASYDPTAVIGALRSKTGSNFRKGRSKYFIAEACEYRRDFLALNPDVLIITNVEHEHVDYYKNLAEVQEAFRELALKVPEDGAVIVNKSAPEISPIIEGITAQVVDYKQHVDLSLYLHLPGLHNRMNAAAASAAAQFLGVEDTFIRAALENYAGTKRRFEYKGEYDGAKVYDDYAHHPTEIRASIQGARDLYPQGRLRVLFQPHTYTRTKELFDEFVSALAKADEVVLVPIYAAREENESGVSSEQLAQRIAQEGTNAQYFHTLEAAAQQIKETMHKGDVVIVMGAGDITDAATQLVS